MDKAVGGIIRQAKRLKKICIALDKAKRGVASSKEEKMLDKFIQKI